MGKLDGRCLCGAVTYSSEAEPMFTGMCHCRDCQRQHGTAFSVVVGVPAGSFRTEGELASHTTVGDDHGEAVQRFFCPGCGSPIYSLSPAAPGLALIKSGTLDDTSWLQPQVEIWGSSAQPWVAEVEGRTRIDRGPTHVPTG
ncbi:MAG: hypothetical protein QOE65_2725 [Solirubrobacteraceae bacterium]|jgi:hypothetical protein|nr:hypothetical protein [Solirubrobacteraceae bacterium]